MSSAPELVFAMPEISRALKTGDRERALELLRRALGTEDEDLAEDVLELLEERRLA